MHFLRMTLLALGFACASTPSQANESSSGSPNKISELEAVALGDIPVEVVPGQWSTTRVAPKQAFAGTFASDPVGYLLSPLRIAERPVLKQSVFVFDGMTSARDIWSVIVFNLNRDSSLKHYDNYIAGAAYRRDVIQLNGGLVFGGELGFADRFGHYKSCCDTVVYSNSLLQSPELWGGLAVRYETPALFGVLNVTPGVVFGLSVIGDPIGQETEHARPGQTSARLLFYLGLEAAFALAGMPNTELVMRLHHRSGGYGTLGGLKEGNNANVIGIRHSF